MTFRCLFILLKCPISSPIASGRQEMSHYRKSINAWVSPTIPDGFHYVARTPSPPVSVLIYKHVGVYAASCRDEGFAMRDALGGFSYLPPRRRRVVLNTG